ncbi:hypothetical protein A2833_03495 [Candidatus Azambacteria bacterium RIFCSPHIGHO2_01_FULL_44_55]|uniref:Uncharacterized protein n=1 Tax=Candidatus Azambacteria bacterium RIFCSPLOWO2_02_FULL_44_14 TaxID=1797306 RepID=A0A1F5CBX3_9BACT|nr:MAG: hypothetical protein A3A18_03060 [Candidatus Azambacteria bacterium RIFCSPLOWO2_01_FULL_44_84]OGD33679.1 MAG: hypothetical protein A3C78_01160 [Candidatus Azambacteria bacterium RIFCSPHIGHO2_02_FULL_45_18]OGD40370.1 MAG: hypothetical protein A3I30_03735 [Candidatus Azambacteria bacterium RIFCSPLOWO2_02_FULL_44_14]OGD40814.1 MAG: hypothetical protein A2833_03495 [Candidatus Azambacteria bacterium RIFCSPHIGHO2_01_FULL_44_55]OGD52218.1 MAG: hypothetical protein A2608_02165 [Candidatus Azam
MEKLTAIFDELLERMRRMGGTGYSVLFSLIVLILSWLLIGWMLAYGFYRKRHPRPERQESKKHGRRIWED